jgi:hypothetical protein
MLIASLTTVARSLSLATGLGGTSLVWGPAATAIAWGLTFSTVVPLRVIPLLVPAALPDVHVCEEGSMAEGSGPERAPV